MAKIRMSQRKTTDAYVRDLTKGREEPVATVKVVRDDCRLLNKCLSKQCSICRFADHYEPAERIIWSNMDIPEDEEETNDEDLQNERVNLDIELPGMILAIADMGLWNGHRSGYKVLGRNVRDILLPMKDIEYYKWYSNGTDIRADMIHHDGTNRMLYREIIKEKQGEIGFSTLLHQIYNNKPINALLLNKYTRSIAPHVNKVYGW